MADRIQPTPRNRLLGLLADAFGGAYDYAQRPDPTMPMGLANPVLGLLSNALPLKASANVLDDLSYGQMPLRGTGMTTRLTPDATELAMAAAPFPKTSGKAALAALGAVDTGVGKAMFIGPTAKTWDKAAAATAQKLEKAGADPRAIWSETGTFKGPDGKWRQEISDDKALFNASSVAGRRVENDLPVGYVGLDLGPTVGGILEHQPLQAAYGTGLTSGTRIGNKNTMFGDGVQGSLDASGVVTINAPAKADQARSTTLHELQHAIQQQEGFAQGGNSMMAFSPKNKEAFALLAQKRQEMRTPLSLDDYTKQAWGMDAPTDEVRKAYADYVKTTKQVSPSADRAAQEWAGKEYYRRLAGEAEARATQARMNMTPEQRRATFPYDSYDVPVNQLIVRGLLD